MFIFSFIILFLTLTFSFGFEVISNYPLPKNNIKQIYNKTKNIDLIISLLKRTNDFENIEFKDNKLILWKKPVIKEINVKGNRSFWKGEIIGVTGILEKHSVDTKTLISIPMRLKQFYMDNGFFDAKIELSVDIGLDGMATINIKIDEGKKFKLNKIFFITERKLTKKEIEKYKKVLDLSKRIVLKYQYILDRLEKLSEFLKKEGFYENLVTIHDIRKVSKDKADLYVNISFGTKYKVIFNGLKSFSSKKIKKHLTFIDTGVSIFQLNKTKENIKNLYIDNGFLDVKVDISLRPVDEFNTVIEINIHEGKQYILRSVKGDLKFLNRYLNKPYKKLKIKKLLEKYVNDLVEKGYLTARYKLREKIEKEGFVDIEIDILKGKKFVLEKLQFKNFSVKESIRLPKPYDGKLLLSLQEKYSKYIKDLGYFDGKVFLDVQIKEKKEYYSVIGIFNFKLGQRYKNGVYFIYGTYHLFPKIIELNLSKDKFFTKKDFDLDLINLYSTYFFDYINPSIFIDKEKKEVNKAVILHEDKRGFFQGSAGYNTDRQFRIQFSLILKNLFNYGFETFVYTELTNQGSSIYKYSMGNRLIPVRINGFLSIYKSFEIHRIYDLDTKGFEITLSKLFTRNIKANLNFKSTKNQIKNNTVDINVTNYNLNRLSSIVTLDYRKPRYNPVGGYINIFKIEKNFKDYSFWKFENFFRYFIQISSFIFSQRIGIGYISEETASIPLSERFFLGGLSTVRGFGYEEIKGSSGSGGNSYAFLNNDIRYLLYQPINLYLLTFVDLGNVFTEKRDLKKFYLRKSAGIGVLVPTPVGSIIFDIARKLDRKPGESLYRFELSIGITF